MRACVDRIVFLGDCHRRDGDEFLCTRTSSSARRRKNQDRFCADGRWRHRHRRWRRDLRRERELGEVVVRPLRAVIVGLACGAHGHRRRNVRHGRDGLHDWSRTALASYGAIGNADGRTAERIGTPLVLNSKPLHEGFIRRRNAQRSDESLIRRAPISGCRLLDSPLRAIRGARRGLSSQTATWHPVVRG